MANQGFGNADRPGIKTPSTTDKVSTSPKDLSEQALSAGRDLRDKAADLAGSSSDAIKSHASGFVDAAKGVASQATDKLKETVDDQKGAGAQYVGNIAGAMRRAAREFENDVPFAASYIRKAAEQIEGVSDSIKNGDLNDLVRTTQSFARRQPTAFLGIAALAGFGIVRFLKSSASAGTSSTRPTSTQPSSPRPGSAGTNYSARASSTNRGYRDEYSN